MSNVDTYRRAHEAFNARNWDEVAAAFTSDAGYTDQPRGMIMKGPQEFVDAMKASWVTSFSDAAVTRPVYLDAGDHVICQFTGTGTQDGPLGPMPATGRRMEAPFCEIMHFDSDGRIVGGELYYDQVTMLVQLGHMPPP